MAGQHSTPSSTLSPVLQHSCRTRFHFKVWVRIRRLCPAGQQTKPFAVLIQVSPASQHVPPQSTCDPQQGLLGFMQAPEQHFVPHGVWPLGQDAHFGFPSTPTPQVSFAWQHIAPHGVWPVGQQIEVPSAATLQVSPGWQHVDPHPVCPAEHGTHSATWLSPSPQYSFGWQQVWVQLLKVLAA